MPEEINKSLNQKKISLAGSEHAPVIIELMRDCMSQSPIVAKTQWDTIVNAITLDVQATMLRNMVDLLEEIRIGKLHEKK